MTGEINPVASRAVTVGDSEARIWGMSSGERLSRIYRRIGVSEAPEQGGDTIAVHAGWVFDESLIKALAGRPRTCPRCAPRCRPPSRRAKRLD